jgi:electron transfer flavoprotein beta subunit
MKVLVCAKRVVDSNVKVRIKADGSDVEIEHCKMSLNPFDENAIEEAVKLKEKKLVNEIIAISIGTDKCVETLRTAMARGADRAILIKTDQDNHEALNIAKILKIITLKEQPDLIILGKQAIDDDANQVGQMLAGMLDYPQGTFISKLELNDNKVLISREIENGTEELEVSLPAILTADLHLNQPRFIKLPQLMLAKKKAVEIVEVSSLKVELSNSTRTIKVKDGEIKKDCQMLSSAAEVINIINNLNLN